MRKFYPFCFLFYLVAFIGCDEDNSKEVSINPDLISHHHRFSKSKWLEDHDNFYKPEYWDSISYYFNRAITLKEYNDASQYLIFYGESISGSHLSDTLFSKTLYQFFNDYQDQINGENYTNIAYYLGIEAHSHNNLQESSEWFQKAINLEPESKSHKQMIGFSNFSLAQNYTLQRDFINAEKHLMKALNIFVDVDDLTNQGTVHLLLYNIYEKKSAFAEAEKILDKGMDILKRQKSKGLIYAGYGCYVHLNVAKADTVHAIKYIDTLKMMADANPRLGMYDKTILTQLLAFKHISQREEEMALRYLDTSRVLSEESGSKDLQMRTLFQELNYSKIFKKPLKDPEEVVLFYKQLSEDEHPNLQFMIQMGHALFKYYTLQGDYVNANKYGQFLIQDSERAAEENIQGKLFELERKYQLKQKENKILIQKKKIKDQQVWIVVIAGSGIVILLILLIIIAWFKNRGIRREKELTESFTSQLLNKTEEERRRISSDLHDSVSNELINLRHALENNQRSLKSKIDVILEEVRTISRNLSPTLFDKLGLEESIEQLAEHAQNQHHFLMTAQVSYSKSLSTEVELQLYRIIQEATTNIIKHANAIAGKITITEDLKNVYAEIKDNGKGFNVESMLEKGNCFGLLNVTERAKLIGGNVNFKSGESGTTILITIPK